MDSQDQEENKVNEVRMDNPEDQAKLVQEDNQEHQDQQDKPEILETKASEVNQADQVIADQTDKEVRQAHKDNLELRVQEGNPEHQEYKAHQVKLEQMDDPVTKVIAPNITKNEFLTCNANLKSVPILHKRLKQLYHGDTTSVECMPLCYFVISMSGLRKY